MDDLALFDDSARQLERARDAAARWLEWERGLRLKVPAARPRSTRRRFTYLGYRLSRAGIAPRRAMIVRAQQGIAAVVRGGSRESVEQSIASYRGLLTFGSGR